ncbi:hypothetical protein D9611_013178 [Ephemerocybe angulata]|uniref:Uncharacterized protein n=1 Tax=Ephemerocybe angulata TaxID=980116 RepID=A0A8H5F9Z8_9AGAR|nr:hypothetical protein D9611_013178 [Tulosesus angulatus]
MESQLPQDVLTIIPSFIDAGNDQISLRNLCLASSIFLCPCQSILFKNILLSGTNKSSPTTGQRLLELLERSPHIVKYVKSVNICEAPPLFNRESWLSTDRALPEALNKLDIKRITSFSLCLYGGNSRYPWQRVLPATQASIIEICPSTSLMELSLQQAPIPLIGLCGPSLKRLSVQDADLSTMSAVAIPRTQRNSKAKILLAHLHLGETSQYTDFARYFPYLTDTENRIELDRVKQIYVKGEDVTRIAPTYT